MILERVEFRIQPGKEDEFSATVDADVLKLLHGEGCRSVQFGRGVENPDKFMLLVGWDSIEKHKAFIGTPDHQKFGTLIRPFVAGAAVEHFDIRQG